MEMATLFLVKKMFTQCRSDLYALIKKQFKISKELKNEVSAELHNLHRLQDFKLQQFHLYNSKCCQ